MNRHPPALPSLKWPLIVQPLLLQFAILFVSFLTIVALATRVDSGGPYTDESITRVIASALVRHGDGRFFVQMTPALAALRAQTPAMWFSAVDESGQRVDFGPVPAEAAGLRAVLGGLSYGHIRDRYTPYTLSAVVRRELSPAGPVTIMAHGRLHEVSFTVLLASSLAALPIFMMMGVVSLVMTPWIVKRSLAGLSRIAHEAQCIGAGRRGMRLSEQQVPREIAPLVTAVNAALERLDDAYERQRRFIASAAHELRTPIAILRIKVDAAQGAEARTLSRDVTRLADLAEQLLDLQRVDTAWQEQDIDLSTLLRRAAADLAPLLIAAGKSIEVKVDAVKPIRGDASALERVVANLVQNAVDHGGTHVTVRVEGHAFEIEDDGPGIPLAERERVFEPFHRLRPRSSGSGLGLHLVQQIVERHGGRVSLLGAAHGGTIARVELPSGPSVEPRFPQS